MTDLTRIVVLGSPFLGPQVWRPVADELESAGHDAVVLTSAGGSVEEILGSMAAQLRQYRCEVIAVHSNAGLYVAELARRGVFDRVVFADALIPGAGPTTPVTSAVLARSLAERADADGLLPAWTDWWPAAELEDLFPDQEARRAVEAGCPRLPASYLTQSVPTPPGWENLVAGYLGFGDTYSEELALAQSLGWPTVVLPGRHLHSLVDPAAVASNIARLADWTRP